MKHSISIFWRDRENHYKLLITKCRNCGKSSYPKLKRCPYCGSINVEVVESKGRGTLVNYTITYFRVDGSEAMLPKVIGLVKLDEGVKVPAEIVDVPDLSSLKPGLEVEAVLRKYSSDDPHGLIYYGLKFIPSIIKKQ